jgi:tRNA dimethylallyltransferase
VSGTPLALVGPTASGKTEASLDLAGRLGAEIVCVDSMLVYRGMDVGTAKPTPEQRALIPHHLIDLADPTELFSVARFQASARDVLREIEAGGHPALLVGGSGLYYRAIVDQLEFPGRQPEARALLEAEGAVLGAAALHGRLASLDPVAAGRIRPENLRRTVRALEVMALTGRSFSSFAGSWERFAPHAVRAAGVDMPRAILHRRIDERVALMLPGLVRETRELLERGQDGFVTSSQAIGYAEAAAFLDGAIGEEEMAGRTGRRTKALARRQMAWFRRDPRIRWFEAGNAGAAGIVDEVAAYLSGEADGRSP